MGAIIGTAGDAVSQVASGEEVNTTSLVYSFAGGIVGGFAGNVASKVIQFSPSVIGKLTSAIVKIGEGSKRFQHTFLVAMHLSFVNFIKRFFKIKNL